MGLKLFDGFETMKPVQIDPVHSYWVEFLKSVFRREIVVPIVLFAIVGNQFQNHLGDRGGLKGLFFAHGRQSQRVKIKQVKYKICEKIRKIGFLVNTVRGLKFEV